MIRIPEERIISAGSNYNAFCFVPADENASVPSLPLDITYDN